MIGQTISHYKITDKLGEGGMGVVYRAEDTKLDRAVALKFLSPQLLEDQEARERFTREAKAAASLDHSNICTIHEIDEADGQTFLAMAYIAGQTVNDKIKERPLRLDEALDISIQTALGLQAAHEKGIVHRDVKSSNLMVTPQGQVKILDFGLAQLTDRSKLTKTATLMGTPAYMSPEQALRRPTDRRTDIWSLGVVLYEMVTGRPPFEGEREQAVLYAIANEEHEPPTALRSGLPVELDLVVSKALAKRPGERYQHADELLVDLRKLQILLVGAEKTAESQQGRRNRKFSSRLWAGAAIAGFTALTVWWLVRPATELPSNSPLPESVPLTTYPGQEMQPDFSPDGNRVVFAWNGESEGNWDIYVKLIGEATSQRLTNDAAMEISPAWSPDDRFVAFVRVGPESAQLVLVPSIGGPERVITTLNDPGNIERSISAGHIGLDRLAWYPDSKNIVVVDREHPGVPLGLFRVSTESGEKRRLTSPPQAAIGDHSPTVSPDGRQIAFERIAEVRESSVYLLNLNNILDAVGEPRKLTGDEFATSPSWSADGREVIYSAGLPIERPQLRRIPARGGESKPISYASGGSEAVLSRARGRMAYVLREANDDIWRADLPDGSNPKPLIRSTHRDLTPQFSPDGQRIAFSSSRSGHREIWVCDNDGSNPVRLTDLQSIVSAGPYWSPDGEEIVFQSNVGNQREVFVVRIAGGTARRLTNDPAVDGQPSWSRDGKWIYFWSDRGNKTQIWKIPVEGGEPTALTEGNYAFESLDGRELYFTKKPPGESTAVWKLFPKDGQPARVIDPVHDQGLDCTITRDALFFLPPEPDAEGKWWVWRHVFASGRSEPAFELPGRAGIGLSASPDGKSILFVLVEEDSSDLVLVENFR